MEIESAKNAFFVVVHWRRLFRWRLGDKAWGIKINVAVTVLCHPFPGIVALLFFLKSDKKMEAAEIHGDYADRLWACPN